MILPLLLVAQQVFSPGQRLDAVCSGQWANTTTSSTAIAADCIEVPVPPPPGNLRIVVDHLSVADFAAVPLSVVQPLRVMSADRSVGVNIDSGLRTCLAVDTPSTPSFCRRWAWNDGSYPSPPMSWTAHPLPNWLYYHFRNSFGAEPQLPCPNLSFNRLSCWESYVDAYRDQWDVVSMQPSYLDAGQEYSASAYLASYEALKVRHPNLVIMLHTSSLPRDPALAATLAPFNEAVRAHVATYGGVLLDIADIETYDPYGMPWSVGGVPVIAPHYTSEVNGGHLQSPSSGMIRIAQAWWVALGQIAGWSP